MKTITLQVQTCNDWQLICAVNWYAFKSDLPADVEGAAMRATWLAQDGYGITGHTPIQGWDWSGIRDSSPEAMKDMAAAIRKVLAKHNISVLQATCDDDIDESETECE